MELGSMAAEVIAAEGKQIIITTLEEQHWSWVPAKLMSVGVTSRSGRRSGEVTFLLFMFNRVPQGTTDLHLPFEKNIWVTLPKVTRPYDALALLCLRTRSWCVWSVSVSLPTSCNTYVTAPLHLWPAQSLDSGNNCPTSGNPLPYPKGNCVL